MLFITVLINLCLSVSFCSYASSKRKRDESYQPPSKLKATEASRIARQQLNPPTIETFLGCFNINDIEEEEEQRTDNIPRRSSRQSKKKGSKEQLSERKRSPKEQLPERKKSPKERLSKPVKSLQKEHPSGSNQDGSGYSKPKRQTTRPNPFEDYSFCAPFPLANDSVIVKTINDNVRESKVSSAMLEYVFSKGLKVIQEKQPEFMDLLKDANSEIIDLHEVIGSLAAKNSNICSEPFNEDEAKGRDCMYASSTLNTIYDFIGMFYIGSYYPLKAGLFVAYLHTIHRAIENHV